MNEEIKIILPNGHEFSLPFYPFGRIKIEIADGKVTSTENTEKKRHI
ncbi:MAG: hypothetical protein LBM95_06675 [Lactobacillales bacterium]|jgi:hypothetical protein|nr:hypothetical protein [Lactobacillales bacterium]